MKSIYQFLFLGALSLNFTLTALETAEEPFSNSKHDTSINSSETYTNSEKGYVLQYPINWRKSEVPQLDLVLFAPQKTDQEIPYASLNVVSEKIGNGINLDQFYAESTTNLSSALKEVLIEKSGSSTLNGTQSKWILYTHIMQGMKFRVLQYFIVANETIYLITFSATAEEFNNYEKEFDQIANSFKILAISSKSSLNTTKNPLQPSSEIDTKISTDTIESHITK